MPLKGRIKTGENIMLPTHAHIVHITLFTISKNFGISLERHEVVCDNKFSRG